MSVNLAKHRENLLSTWNDVLDDKTPTDWALFGYEKQSYDLMVVGKGDGGLEELAEELNTAKIMYAVCRVADPKTSLPKCVLILWQGEGAPLSKKGICSNHITDISRFFKGIHVQINARTEEDIEPSIILDKVARSSSSRFDFKERSEPVENMTPVSSVYKRTVPTQEINSTARQNFWKKEQKEEESRQTLEKQRLDEERKKLDQERKQREMQEASQREEKFKERSHSINKMREATKNAENTARTLEREREDWERQLKDNVRDEEERQHRGESLKQLRSTEAQSLISKRTINARAIFEQNTSAGQMSTLRNESQVPLNHSAHTPDEEAALAVLQPVVEPTVIPPPAEPLEQATSLQVWDDEQLAEQLLRANSPHFDDPEEEDRYLREKLAASPLLIPSKATTGLKARALYDYQAADETEISFDPDDIITEIDKIDEGWWQGAAPDGTFGLFPANYVEIFD